MKKNYILINEWPPLAWIAECSTFEKEITIYHGAKLEIHDNWFCEAVWAGEFSDGNFDSTDLIAGSGGKIYEDNVIFVSSGSTVDRLHSIEKDEVSWVSNSLSCLLLVLDGSLISTYSDYYKDMYSIVYGLDKYKKYLCTTIGKIRITYFNNLKWDLKKLISVEKPNKYREFNRFSEYKTFLENTLNLISCNATSSQREHPYKLLGTLSTGYDSTTISALAKNYGCEDVVCFDQDYSGDNDSGHAVANILGLKPIKVSVKKWREYDFPEIPFLAANAMGEEVRFKALEPSLFGTVLLTGYHGDKVWDKGFLESDCNIVRGDPSGLGLSEYRLWAGFIHCPVPFWGVRQINQLRQISDSKKMKKWDYGGNYSRPICRRICEESGIPREVFGIKKRNASIIMHNYESFLTNASFESYCKWLKEKRFEFIEAGKIPPIPSQKLDYLIYKYRYLIVKLFSKLPGLWRISSWIESKPIYLRRFVFPWAIEQAKQRYISFKINNLYQKK